MAGREPRHDGAGGPNVKLNHVVLQSLPPVSVGLGALYAAFAVSHLVVLPRAIAAVMSPVAAGTSLVLFSLAVVLRRRSFAPRWAHAIGAGIAGLVLANSLLHLTLTGELRQTTNLLLLIVGAGSLFLSTGWLALVVAVTLIGWAAAVLAHPPIAAAPPSASIHYGIALLSGTVLSGLAHAVRVRNLQRLQRLRIRDEKRKEELEAALRAARESEERYYDLLHSANDLVQSVAPDGSILYVNRAWRETLGYSKEEVKDLSIFEVIHPDSQDHCRAILRRLIEEGCSERVETTFVTKDGEEIIVEGNINCRFEDGTPVATRGIFRDVTERVRAERALKRQNRRLMARNEELDAFAHTVAHDLKNPLQHLLGYADLLRDDYETLPNDVREEALATIAGTADRMNNIIGELLLLSEVRRGEVDTEPLDMAAIVAAVKDRLGYLIDRHDATVTTPDSWPRASGHAPWIEEVWTNYLSNAIKYGGRPPRVELGATSQPDGTVRFWVRDNGPGLTSEEQAKLFTPFSRLHQIKAEGHGLGLSIVRRIMDKLGGEVGVESEVNEGSTFFFTLPQA